MASLEKAFGYQGDNMNLPVEDLATALPFYENVLGFRVVSRSEAPHNAAVLARDQIQIRLAEKWWRSQPGRLCLSRKRCGVVVGRIQNQRSAKGAL